MEANLDSTSEPSSSRGVTARRQGRRQGIFWLCTVPFDAENANPDWTTALPAGVSWIRGQKETGETTGYEHWQFLVAFSQKVSIIKLQEMFGRRGHYELSRSDAAAAYVWKEATRVEGTQFEFGAKPFRRNSRTDWEQVWNDAKSGKLESIPANVRVVSYRSLRSIAADYDEPRPIVRTCFVFWGVSGTGKSRRAWDEAGLDAYPKDPRTKFWCGYQGQANVVLDEFRGGIK